jgi:hypothetical protein
LLDKDYEGSAIRVRRASDNAEQDIGFDGNGDLDTTALATFCSGTNGFVKTWYCQSGNGNNAEQTTTGNQPKIYDSVNGVIEEGSVGNEKPALEFNGTSHWMSSLGFGTGSERSVFNLLKGTGNPASGYSTYWMFPESVPNLPTGDFIQLYSNDYTSSFIANFSNNSLDITSLNGLQNQSIVSVLKSTSNSYLFQNGVIVGSASGAQSLEDRFSIGLFNSNYGAQKQQEIIIYNSDQSTNRTGIETNINDYYNIYTP